MIAGQAENIFHALELERFTNEMTSGGSRHLSSPKRLRLVLSIPQARAPVLWTCGRGEHGPIDGYELRVLDR
jgi:hypothetical protein